MQRKLTVYCRSFYGLLEINMTEKKNDKQSFLQSGTKRLKFYLGISDA